mgnify:CR=1 FL=1
MKTIVELIKGRQVFAAPQLEGQSLRLPNRKEIGAVRLVAQSAEAILSHVENHHLVDAANLADACSKNGAFSAGSRQVFRVLNNAILSLASDPEDRESRAEVIALIKSAGQSAVDAQIETNASSRKAERVAGAEMEKDPIYTQGTSFAPKDGASASKLRQSLNSKGFSVGRAPITFVLSSSIDMGVVNRHFTAKLLGQYLTIERQQVVGFKVSYLEDKGLSKNRDDKLNPWGSAAIMLANNWGSKQGMRYQALENTAGWGGGIWVALLSLEDLKVLGRATTGSSGHFKYRTWGLSYGT